MCQQKHVKLVWGKGFWHYCCFFQKAREKKKIELQTLCCAKDYAVDWSVRYFPLFNRVCVMKSSQERLALKILIDRPKARNEVNAMLLVYRRILLPIPIFPVYPFPSVCCFFGSRVMTCLIHIGMAESVSPSYTCVWVCVCSPVLLWVISCQPSTDQSVCESSS